MQCGKRVKHRRVVAYPSAPLPKTGPYCSLSCRNKALCSGKKFSAERRENMKGRVPWNLGKEHSEATKAKIAAKASLRVGKLNPHWKGGRSIRQDGYVLIRVDGRPKLEHVQVMELHLGRRLTRSELVHHQDGNRQNNAPENLRLMTISEHMRLHHPNGITARPMERICRQCGIRFMGNRRRQLCSDSCRRLRQRQHWQRYDAKRKAQTASVAVSG